MRTINDLNKLNDILVNHFNEAVHLLLDARYLLHGCLLLWLVKFRAEFVTLNDFDCISSRGCYVGGQSNLSIATHAQIRRHHVLIDETTCLRLH